MCGSREDAEDLVQDTFARVLAKPRLLRNDDDLGYLLRVLRNTFVSRHRASTRRPVTTAMPETFEPVDHSIGSRPEAAFGAREVFAHIAALPEAFRDALVAVDVVGPLLRRGGPRARAPARPRSPAASTARGRRSPAGWNRTAKASCRSRHGRHRSPHPGPRPAPRGGARGARARARRARRHGDVGAARAARADRARPRARASEPSPSLARARRLVRGGRRRGRRRARHLARRRLGPERPGHRRARRRRGRRCPPRSTTRRNDALLQTKIEGLPFPDWDQFEWRAVGARNDEIEGRRATTVFYDNPKGARRGLHDPRRLGHQGPRGREDGRRAGHAVLRHVPRGAAGRRVGPRRPHVRHERAAVGPGGEPARSWPPGTTAATSRSDARRAAACERERSRARGTPAARHLGAPARPSAGGRPAARRPRAARGARSRRSACRAAAWPPHGTVAGRRPRG